MSSKRKKSAPDERLKLNFEHSFGKITNGKCHEAHLYLAVSAQSHKSYTTAVCRENNGEPPKPTTSPTLPQIRVPTPFVQESRYLLCGMLIIVDQHGSEATALACRRVSVPRHYAPRQNPHQHYDQQPSLGRLSQAVAEGNRRWSHLSAVGLFQPPQVGSDQPPQIA